MRGSRGSFAEERRGEAKCLGCVVWGRKLRDVPVSSVGKLGDLMGDCSCCAEACCLFK